MTFRRLLLWLAALLSLGLLAFLGFQYSSTANPSALGTIKLNDNIEDIKIGRNNPDARLHQIYRLMAAGKSQDALLAAEQLTLDFPNFQLAQLVYADLLTGQTKNLEQFGDVDKSSLSGTTKAQSSPLPSSAETLTGSDVLSRLRQEYISRQRAIFQRPEKGSYPKAFLAVAAPIKHVIAVDAEHSRLYLFKATPQGLSYLKDFYATVGRAGVGKNVQGDEKTPLGIYFITSRIEKEKLQDFYGSGAFPLNYPNPVDSFMGRTGNGIWLHGSPPSQFARFPQSSNGCVVLSDPDMAELLNTVDTKSTPVVVTSKIDWVDGSNQEEISDFKNQALGPWFNEWSSGNSTETQKYYFSTAANSHATFPTNGKAKGTKISGLSLIYSSVNPNPTMVAVFTATTGDGVQNLQQYWIKRQDRWIILNEKAI